MSVWHFYFLSLGKFPAAEAKLHVRRLIIYNYHDARNPDTQGSLRLIALFQQGSFLYVKAQKRNDVWVTGKWLVSWEVREVQEKLVRSFFVNQVIQKMLKGKFIGIWKNSTASLMALYLRKAICNRCREPLTPSYPVPYNSSETSPRA